MTASLTGIMRVLYRDFLAERTLKRTHVPMSLEASLATSARLVQTVHVCIISFFPPNVGH